MASGPSGDTASRTPLVRLGAFSRVLVQGSVERDGTLGIHAEVQEAERIQSLELGGDRAGAHVLDHALELGVRHHGGRSSVDVGLGRAGESRGGGGGIASAGGLEGDLVLRVKLVEGRTRLREEGRETRGRERSAHENEGRVARGDGVAFQLSSSSARNRGWRISRHRARRARARRTLDITAARAAGSTPPAPSRGRRPRRGPVVMLEPSYAPGYAIHAAGTLPRKTSGWRKPWRIITTQKRNRSQRARISSSRFRGRLVMISVTQTGSSWCDITTPPGRVPAW